MTAINKARACRRSEPPRRRTYALERTTMKAPNSGLEAREQRDYRRKVDITERGVPTGIDVVELISVEAEDGIGGEMHDENDRRRAAEQKRRHNKWRLSGVRIDGYRR